VFSRSKSAAPVTLTLCVSVLVLELLSDSICIHGIHPSRAIVGGVGEEVKEGGEGGRGERGVLCIMLTL
jgi:hypothetical protein